VYDVYDIYHTELNCFGLYFYKQAMLRPYKSRATGEDIRVIHSTVVFARLDEFLDSAAKFYREIGYWGVPYSSAWISATLRAADWARTLRPGLMTNRCPRLNRKSIGDSKPELILNAARRVGWAFGWNVTEQLLSQFYKKAKGR
jgi:hypothetical protein